MAELRNQTAYQGRVRDQAAIDQGLRSYMLRVYNYMAVAIGVTGVAALLAANLATTNDPTAAVAQMANGTMLTAFGHAIFASPLKWVVMLAPLGFVFLFSSMVNRVSVSTGQFMLYAFGALMGLSLSSVFLVFTGESITQTFFVTAAAFAGLSLYGYTTKRDLSAFGTFLVMGLIGLIIASVVNIFLQSSGLQFVISVAGVLIFAGLTAWDTQRIKAIYDQVAHDETLMGRTAIMGALSLYLNFINLFMFLLQFMGNRE
ncbi:MAG: Bax inhibitor-1/YccA family protein [Pseudomonadota bacterium]